MPEKGGYIAKYFTAFRGDATGGADSQMRSDSKSKKNQMPYCDSAGKNHFQPIHQPR